MKFEAKTGGDGYFYPGVELPETLQIKWSDFFGTSIETERTADYMDRKLREFQRDNSNITQEDIIESIADILSGGEGFSIHGSIMAEEICVE